jgi:hypothetical protein
MLHRLRLRFSSIVALDSLLSIHLSLCPCSVRRSVNVVPPFFATPKYKYSSCWICNDQAKPSISERCNCSISLSPPLLLVYYLEESELGIGTLNAARASPVPPRPLEFVYDHRLRTVGILVGRRNRELIPPIESRWNGVL